MDCIIIPKDSAKKCFGELAHNIENECDKIADYNDGLQD
jgi:hypothetical protein